MSEFEIIGCTMLAAQQDENAKATSLLGTSPRPQQIPDGVIKRSQIPTLRHRLKRLNAVGQGPYRSGRSHHGAPARNTQEMPLRIGGQFLAFTPRLFFGNGRSTLHSKSVRS